MRNFTIALLGAIGAQTADAAQASTTRYWDCSGGACGCGFGEKDKEIYCHSNALRAAPADNKYGAKYYGAAAISATLGGDYWDLAACGSCFKVTGTANVPGKSHTSTVVLKATNFCPDQNAVCAGQAHFDIAAPGFDYPNTSYHNTCDTVETEQALKAPQTCGMWMIRSQDPSEGCSCSDFNDPTLQAGCENFLDLGWNNPDVDYEEVDCPAELVASPPCWHDNGEQWPETAPAACAAPSNSIMEVFAKFLLA